MERMTLHRLETPWQPDQVMALNRFQNSGVVHPFTCPQHSDEPLVATTKGWVCMVEGCSYMQNWAWKEMLVDPRAPIAGNA